MKKENNTLLWGGVGLAAVAFLMFGKKTVDTAIDTAVHYSLSTSQANKILQLHPAARLKFYGFIREVQEKLGWNALIPYDPYRTFQKQLQLYNENHSNAKPGYSMHNYGMAMDINFQKGTTILRKGDPDSAWINSGIIKIAKKWGLFWGGDLSTYQDAVHFDLRNFYDINVLRSKAIKQFGSIENVKGNELDLAA